MENLDNTKLEKSETSVIRYFGSNTNFVQMPNPLLMHALEDEGEPFDLIVYSLLYSSCFNRNKGDFNTKFNLSTMSELLSASDKVVRESLNRLIKAKHVKVKEKKKLGGGNVYLELWVATRVNGRQKFLKDEQVG